MKLSLSATLSTVALSISLVAGAAYAADKPPAVSAEMQIFIDKVKADKKMIVSQNMGLTEEQAKAFWPVYEEYQKELTALNQRLAKGIKSYADAYNAGPIADDVATKLTNESVAIDEAEASMRKTFAAKMLKVIPPSKAARYLQIENKIRAILMFELAAQIPLVK